MLLQSLNTCELEKALVLFVCCCYYWVWLFFLVFCFVCLFVFRGVCGCLGDFWFVLSLFFVVVCLGLFFVVEDLLSGDNINHTTAHFKLS